MAELRFNLPAFAADFSGAASLLSSMKALVAMYGPTQCLKSYTSFDAPNWFSSPGMVFSTYMDEDDAIMGNYREITERIANSASKHKPDFLAVIGSPVSAITGADHRGIAMEAENISGIPAIGVETSGSHDYSYGIEKTYAALADRFLLNERNVESGTINILGYNYLDYCDDKDIEALCSYYVSQGKKLKFVSGKSGIKEFENLQNAELNVVVSASGIKFAKYLKEVYGMDFTCDLPINGSMPAEPGELNEKKCLFIGDQVMNNNIRRLFESRYGLSGDVATFFTFDKRSAKPGDMKIETEPQFNEVLSSGKYIAVVCDPSFMFSVRCPMIPLPLPAISSKLFWREHISLFTDRFATNSDRFLGKYLKK